MSHFYLTLPSNSSMEYYPSNTLAKYTTKLQNEISLQGEWEVGLTEIIFPRNWLNVGEKQFINIYLFAIRYPLGHPDYDVEILKVDHVGKYDCVINVPIRMGHYNDIVSLLLELNKQLESARESFINTPNLKRQFITRLQRDDGWFKFRYDRRANLVKVYAMPMSSITLTSDLIDMLGFSRDDFPLHNDVHTSKIIQALRESAIDSESQTMYMYCDVVECVPVGNTSVPLLRVIGVESSFRSIVQRSFDRPRYLPLRKLSFESLEIDIRDGLGRAIPFESGTVIATLHFRRASSSYLLT